MYEVPVEVFLSLLPWALIGATVRMCWGILTAYDTVLAVQLSRARLVTEFSFSLLFGIFSGVLMSQLGYITIGPSFGTLLCSMLGKNAIDMMLVKFGWKKKFEVIVSDQQLGLEDLNSNQINALTFAKLRGSIDNIQYQRLNRTTRNVARYELMELVDAGRMRMIGRGKAINYLLVARKVVPVAVPAKNPG